MQPYPSLSLRNKNQKVTLENLNKSAIEISIESAILLNLVNLCKIFCEGLFQETECTFN